jgi:hypothetical protein
VSAPTPGPWQAHVHGGCWYVFAGSAMVADDGADETPCVARMRGVGRGATEEEQEANAHLIAAAPRLLEQLGNLVGLAKYAGPRLGQYEAALADAQAAIDAAQPPPDHGYVGDGTWRCLACGQPKDAHPAAVPPEPGR